MTLVFSFKGRFHADIRERNGSAVERRTMEREVGGSKLASAVLCP